MHLPIHQLLRKLNSVLLEPVACGLEIVDGDADVPEALRIAVAVVVFEVGVFFGSVIACQYFCVEGWKSEWWRLPVVPGQF